MAEVEAFIDVGVMYVMLLGLFLLALSIVLPRLKP